MARLVAARYGFVLQQVEQINAEFKVRDNNT